MGYNVCFFSQLHLHTEYIAKLYLNTVGKKVYFQVIFICLGLRLYVSLCVVSFLFFKTYLNRFL